MRTRTIKLTALFLCLAFAFASCAVDPNTGQRTLSKAGQGAVIGAAGGAILGVIIGGDRKGAIIGAGIGALAGAVVGNYMDQQEAELRQATAGTAVEVSRKGEQIQLTMPDTVTFATGSADLSPQARTTLAEVADVINKYEKSYVDIIGHTDDVGTAANNQRLSEQRAASVAQYFMNQGLRSERIRSEGRGETLPIASNATPEGRSQNRRVEIIITPLT